MPRPHFQNAWQAFMAVRVPVADMAKVIGGNVQKNIELPTGGFENACPIRVSYVLNMTGFQIQKSNQYAMVSGRDNRQYVYRVGDMMTYLERTFGKPDKTFSSFNLADFANMKGLLVVNGHGRSNAKGHITLWYGTQMRGHLPSDVRPG
jgi:hypothetical protein